MHTLARARARALTSSLSSPLSGTPASLSASTAALSSAQLAPCPSDAHTLPPASPHSATRAAGTASALQRVVTPPTEARAEDSAAAAERSDDSAEEGAPGADAEPAEAAPCASGRAGGQAGV